MPESPLSNKQHPTKHIWWGKTQTASWKPISWLGCKRKPWDSQGCTDGGEEPNTHNLMSQLKQSITFFCNTKAGKSPVWHAQQPTQFALLLGLISRKLLTLTCIVALHAAYLCTQALMLEISPVSEDDQPSPPLAGQKALKEDEQLPTGFSSAVPPCAQANEISSWPQQSNLFMINKQKTELSIWAWNWRAFTTICLTKLN